MDLLLEPGVLSSYTDLGDSSVLGLRKNMKKRIGNEWSYVKVTYIQLVRIDTT